MRGLPTQPVHCLPEMLAGTPDGSPRLLPLPSRTTHSGTLLDRIVDCTRDEPSDRALVPVESRAVGATTVLLRRTAAEEAGALEISSPEKVERHVASFNQDLKRA